MAERIEGTVSSGAGRDFVSKQAADLPVSQAGSSLAPDGPRRAARPAVAGVHRGDNGPTVPSGLSEQLALVDDATQQNSELGVGPDARRSQRPQARPRRERRLAVAEDASEVQGQPGTDAGRPAAHVSNGASQRPAGGLAEMSVEPVSAVDIAKHATLGPERQLDAVVAAVASADDGRGTPDELARVLGASLRPLHKILRELGIDDEADRADLMQGAWTALLSKWDSVQPEARIGYFRTTLRNGAIDLFRARTRHGEVLGDTNQYADVLVDPATESPSLVGGSDGFRVGEILGMLGTFLNPKEVQLFLQKEMFGFSVREIAEMRGTSDASVKSSLDRIRGKVAKNRGLFA